MIEGKNTIWINPRCISKIECIEVTDVPNFSWCVIVHTDDGSSYDMHYSFDRDSAINYANEYIGRMK